MAITIDNLVNALRLEGTAAEIEQLNRILNYAMTAVENLASGAPDAVKDEAIVRISAYAYDRPLVAKGTAYADVIRNSGAASALLPYRSHRARAIGS